jgi:hypothetical protein
MRNALRQIHRRHGRAAAIVVFAVFLQSCAGMGDSTVTPGVDLTGVWLGVGHAAQGKYRNSDYPYPPPFTEKGRELSQFWADPKNNLGARCLPGGGPAGMMNGSDFFPIEIIQRPEQITIIFELMQQVRRVYMDGRAHPAPGEFEKSWMGHSIGHWEGDTLVIDTVGVKAGALNGSGAAVVQFGTDKDPRMPYSDTLHAVERLRQLDDGQILEDEVTIDDPTVYTEPFTLKRYWVRSPDLDMMEYVCGENPRPEDEGYGHLLEQPHQ